MDNIKGKMFSDASRYKPWRCKNNNCHVLGATERARVNIMVGDRSLRYYTTRLLVFREALDLNADIPDVIEVHGVLLDGRLLNMAWKCTLCGGVKEWHPDEASMMEWLARTYLAE
jgi:hypothetical protein